MIIKCGGIYAAEYTKAEVDEMLKQMSAFQKGISLQKATERFMTGERARATGLGVDVIRVPAARAFNLKEPKADADGIVWMNAQQMQAHIEKLKAEGKS